ncbi:hypothetical protein JTB14_030259 [Gonioctena quinquepunctata]|nr:hypothetical protein JTB14_030259 [Gonioctena quinquepunctata]
MEDKYTQQLLKWYEEVPTDTEEDSDDFSDAPSEHKTDTEQSAESEVDDVQAEVAANITEKISATAPRLYKKSYVCGVDVVDGMKCEYSVTRVSNHWPFTVFCSLFNIASINAQIINLNKTTTRRAFITELAESLALPQLTERSDI